MLKEEFVVINPPARTAEDVIRILAKNMYDAGCVSDTYCESVLQREKDYPTGLLTENLGFAIPHTYCEHVLEPTIAVAKLEHPVEFVQMGTQNEIVQVEIVFLMAIKNPEEQLDTIKMLTNIFQNNEKKASIMRSTSRKELFEVLKYLNEIPDKKKEETV